MSLLLQCMRQRILTALIALTVVTSGFAGVAAAEVGTTTEQAQQSNGASVTFANQTTGGDAVTVDSVTLPDGGYVTIHDASLADGEPLGSVAGTSAYLSPGTHENVTVTLTDDVSEGSYTAMAHRETDGDRSYDFVASNGETDGPYTADGGAVVDSATVSVSATVSMSDQPTNGDNVVVDRVVLSEGGFVTVHDATVTEGAVFESIRGSSAYLEAGVHENVRIELDDAVTENTTLVPMAHMDTDGDESYTFPESDGSEDGPYTDDGSAVTDTASVTASASVSIADQSSDGTTVVIDRVDMQEGGFVAIHDGTLFDGAVFDSVVGHSEYLEAGVHEDVTVTLDERLTSGQTLVAMPHTDSDGDENYTFAESEGGADGPYTVNGGAVVDTAETTIEASIDFEEQSGDGETVTVSSVTLEDGGFVTVHDASVTEGAVFDSVRGTSEYLGPGTHENVTVTLEEPLEETTTLVPMAHRDTDGDESYTFIESEGSADGPYVAGGGAVVASASYTVDAEMNDSADEQMADEEMDEMETQTDEQMNGTENGTATTGGSGPGFTLVAGLLAVVAAALLAGRRQQ